MHRPLAQRQLGEVIRGDHRVPHVGHGPHLTGVAGLGHGSDGAHPRRRHLTGDWLEPPRLEDQAVDDAIEEQEHPRRDVAGLGDDRLRFRVADHGDVSPQRKLLVVEIVEQVDPAELLERRALRLGHALARYS